MSDWLPMDQEQSQLQIESICTLLGSSSVKVVDVGCGDGRLVVPLALAGHTVVGIDIDPTAIDACSAHCEEEGIEVRQTAIDACSARCEEEGIEVRLILGDLFDVLPLTDPVDVILCCGQTFMLHSDVAQAVEALKLFRSSIRNDGMVILDDIPGDLWPEVIHGSWINGISDDETMQLVWADNDAVFTIREGDQIDPNSWQLREDDRRYRLWTMGALRLAAALAGLSVPEVPVAGAVLIMRASSQSN